MNGRELAAWAELLQLHAIWIVATVLLGDVVAFFAIYACHGDLWPNIGALAGHDDSPRFEPWKTQVGFPITPWTCFRNVERLPGEAPFRKILRKSPQGETYPAPL